MAMDNKSDRILAVYSNHKVGQSQHDKCKISQKIFNSQVQR